MPGDSKSQPVIKHFDLCLGALDVVGSVAASVDCHLLNDELRVVTLCYELGMLPQKRVLPNLSFDKLYRFLDLVQDGSLIPCRPFLLAPCVCSTYNAESCQT